MPNLKTVFHTYLHLEQKNATTHIFWITKHSFLQEIIVLCILSNPKGKERRRILVKKVIWE